MSSAALSSYQTSQTKSLTIARPQYDDDSPRGHHIVAQEAKLAQPSRDILISVGIEYKRDPINLVMIPQRFYKSMHTEKYYKYVNNQLSPYRRDIKGVQTTILRLRYEILLAAEGEPIPWE